jgi:hypothetical protein
MYTISILHAGKIAEYHQAFNEELKLSAVYCGEPSIHKE